MPRALFLFLLAFLAAPAAAQLAVRDTAIKPQLVAEGPAVAGGEVELAILMRTRPGWHGYWQNPGDAGLPMTIDWTLPDGASLGPLRFPIPGRLTIAGLMNYVYKGDHAILTRLKLPSDARSPLRIAAAAQWLACTDTLCVPEQGRFELILPVGPPTARRDPRFDGWRRQLPRPLASPARFAVEGRTLSLAVPLPASVTLGEPYVFPAAPGTIVHAAEQSFRRSGDWLIAEMERDGDVPDRLDAVVALGDGRGLEVTAVPGAIPSGGRPVGALGWTAVLLAIGGALLGGLLLNLMPCVFPILALKALHLARGGGQRRDALAYTAGAVVGTGLLGALLLAIRAGGSAAGWAFQLQDPRTILLLMLLALAIALNLVGLFRLPALGGNARPGGSFATGALAAFVATPCAGPFLGAALGTALLLPAAGAIAVFAALGLGLALPFLAIAFIPALGRRLPRPGEWMVRLQRFLAIPMLATAVACLWLLSRQGGEQALTIGLAGAAALLILLAGIGAWQRRGHSVGWPVALLPLALAAGLWTLVPQGATTASRRLAGAEPWSEARVAQTLAAGRPAFVYFTADWCLTCKANEAGAIERDSVRQAFRAAGVRVMAADWTNGDPAIGRFLERRGRAGVPLYLWYRPGTAQPEELPQLLTPTMLIERARQP